MQIISISTSKGGSAKSTIASNLLVAGHLAGLRVLGVDCDPQGTLASWARIRKAPPPVAHLPEGASGQLLDLLSQARDRGDDLCILDTAGLNSYATTAAMNAADFVLVPVRPTTPDALAVRTTVTALLRAGKKFATVISQAPPGRGDARARELSAGLSTMGLVATPVIHSRAAFQDAFAVGKGTMEYEPGGAAATEISELFNWLQQETSHD